MNLFFNGSRCTTRGHRTAALDVILFQPIRRVNDIQVIDVSSLVLEARARARFGVVAHARELEEPRRHPGMVLIPVLETRGAFRREFDSSLPALGIQKFAETQGHPTLVGEDTPKKNAVEPSRWYTLWL